MRPHRLPLRHPTALLHIRQILHWTGRPGPKSGTDLSDITQSEPQLTLVRGVRVASTSHSTQESNRLLHLLFPELRAKARDWPRRAPWRRYTCAHCCSTRRNPSPPVRINGQGRLHFLLLYVYLSSASSLGCREPLPLLDKPTLGSISVHTDVHVTAHPRMASLFTGAGGAPVPLSESRPPHDGRAPPQHQHSAALPETPQTLSTA